MRRFCSLMLLCVVADPVVGNFELHVATDGRELASGTATDPIASFSGARDRIRELRSKGELEPGSIEVLIHAGRYELASTLEFGSEDSGDTLSPIIYRSHGGEVVVSGGVRLNDWNTLLSKELTDRLPQSARDHVVAVDMTQLGVQPENNQPRRLHQPMPIAPVTLYCSDKVLPRAGWPNDGWAVAKHPTDGNLAETSRHWQLERAIHPADQHHVWAHGFWQHDWSDSLEPVAIDLRSATLSLTSSDALSPKRIQDGARYRIENVLGELDAPGEWYADASSGLLLFWPPADLRDSNATIAILDTVISLYDAQNIRFEGIRFETARSTVVEIAGGCDVLFQDCEIGQAGHVAVHVFRGARHRVVGCNLFASGSSAIRIEGGDRPTLAPAEHLIEACSIHDFCVNYRAGRAAVAVYGVGNVVRKNHIHTGPDSAVCLFGNEHIVEHNHIHHVCREADDSAAVHLSYDPTYRGNVIRKNYIHDLGGFSKTGVFGIYLDDFASGTVVADNLLRNTIRGIAIGGGRDNVIENNSIEGALASIQVDARGTTWASHRFQGEASEIHKLCQSTLQNAPIFAERYPELVSMMEDSPAIPKGNLVRSNTLGGGIGIDLHGIAGKYVQLENNTQRSPSDLAGSDVDSIAATLEHLGIDPTAIEMDADSGRAHRARVLTSSTVNKGELKEN